MRKKIFILIVISFFSISNGFAWFWAYDLTGSGSGWDQLQYEKFQTEIKVQGLFYETAINMKVKLGKRDWNCEEPYSGKYEFVWTFYLPDESVITDCLLWDESENKYISAQLIDLATAEASYDRNSPNIPQLLLREYRNRNYSGNWDHFYQLKISPVEKSEVKDVIIKYITPCQMYWDVRRIGIHSRQFYNPYTRCNTDASAEFKVIDYDNPDKAPRIVNDMPSSWEKQGDFWYAKTGPYNPSFYYDSILRVEKEEKSGKFLQIYDDGVNQFYQLATLPHIQNSDRPARHIIIAIDLIDEHVDNYHYYDSREQTIERLKWPMLYGATTKDSIVFVTSDFNVKWLDNQFIQSTKDIITARLETIKTIVPKLNTLPFMLREAVQFLNDRNLPGEIWYISNDKQHSDPAATAMDIVQQTYFSAKNQIKFRIIDAAYKDRNSYYINNKRYRGNEYLYENLSRLSKGTMVTLINEYNYNRVDAMLDCLAPMVSSVEIDPIPEAGISFSRITLNRGRQNFNITSRYFEIGLFDGNAPFQINYFGKFNNNLYHKNFSIEENNSDIPEDFKSKVKQFWYAQYIINELLPQPQSYSTIKYIEQLSVENQILTPYSGLIIPGPGGNIAFQKLAAEDTMKIEKTDDDENGLLPKDFTISNFPNPFNPTTTIIIEIPKDFIDDQIDIKIINLLGQTIKSYRLSNNNGLSKINFVWNGFDDANQHVSSGIYFVSLKVADIVKKHKITLLR